MLLTLIFIIIIIIVIIIIIIIIIIAGFEGWSQRWKAVPPKALLKVHFYTVTL
jgi:ABC-type sulfate transport system permease component